MPILIGKFDPQRLNAVTISALISSSLATQLEQQNGGTLSPLDMALASQLRQPGGTLRLLDAAQYALDQLKSEGIIS